MHRIFLIVPMLIMSCASDETKTGLISQQYTQSEDITPMHKSTASLDRMLVTTEDMIQDMDKMNRNLDAIFRAVTKCEDDHDCEVLKQAFAEKAEAERAQRESQ